MSVIRVNRNDAGRDAVCRGQLARYIDGKRGMSSSAIERLGLLAIAAKNGGVGYQIASRESSCQQPESSG